MNSYQNFVFEDYSFDENAKTLRLHYSLDEKIRFEEHYVFNFNFADYDPVTLDKAFQQLFFMAGVSYYKTYIPPTIVVKTGTLNEREAEFYEKTYQKGLGEFFYVNNLDPHMPVTFSANSQQETETHRHDGSGFLVAVGGGKDSIVSLELLRTNTNETVETWSLNHKNQLSPLVERIGSKHYYVDRFWDSKLNNPDSLPGRLNGHVPISAIFACTGVIVAILTGRRDVVMSNERSADEPTLIYRGTPINHQYSKSSEFERDFQSQISTVFGDSIRYYSLLRPLAEIQITKLFASGMFEKYQDVFSSCNRAFTHDSPGLFWDGECPKCAFVYLMLSEYVKLEQLDKLTHGNMLLKPQLENTYKELLGITANKPLECVGEINESRWAMTRRKRDFPELEKFEYESVDEREVFYLADSLMPDDVRSTILPVFEQSAGPR